MNANPTNFGTVGIIVLLVIALVQIYIAWRIAKFFLKGPAKLVWAIVKGLAKSVFYTGKGLWLAARGVVLGIRKVIHWLRTHGDENVSEALRPDTTPRTPDIDITCGVLHGGRP